MPVPGDEHRPELPALLAADGDVVQVRLVAGQPPGAGDRLVERGVDAPVGGDLRQQALAVGAAQLLDLAVGQQRLDELGPLVAQLLQAGGVGAGAGLGLLHRREAALGEQDLAQLDRRVEVERPADDLVQHAGQALHLGGQALEQDAQLVDVDGDAGVLHPGEHAHQRVLDRVVEVAHALLVERGEQRPGDAVDRQRLAGGAHGVVVALTEVELAGCHRVAVGEAHVRVALEQPGDRVRGLGRVEQVGGDRGVELQPDLVDLQREQRCAAPA